MYSLRKLQVSHKCTNLKWLCLPNLMSTPSRIFCSGKERIDLLKMNFKLPRQHVPPLSSTINKYLKSIKPFVNEEEYINTVQVVNDFEDGGSGEKLQKYLCDKATKEENWLAHWWLNTAYLEFRNTVVIWSSPGLVFPHVSFASTAEQLTYAANIVSAALNFKDDVYNGNINPEKAGNALLDMGQYYKIFGTCRIPKPERDTIVFRNTKDMPKHIVVAHNNHFFKLNVYVKGNLLSIEDIYDNLLAIVECSLEKEVPIGVLTSDNRDNWSKAYTLLLRNKTNTELVEELQSGLFLLCLDDQCKISDVDKKNSAALQLIHGGGSHHNGGNRWFDKTIQIVVNNAGEVGITYEHSPAEGQPIAVMMDYIQDKLKKEIQVVDTAAIRNFNPQYEKLSFVIDEAIKNCIKVAQQNLDNLVQDLEMNCFTYVQYGKNFIKSQKISPDSYIQMALQLAFYRLHKTPGAQYETASMRKFLHGRTETIRSCSVESISFVKQMLSKEATNQDKLIALKVAVDTHKRYTLEAMDGNGIDRHLLGLKLAAIELGMKVPKLYEDVAYTRSVHMRVSTSQVASKYDAFMCYGPLVNDGYACCYNPRSEDMNFAIAALRSCKETDATAFRDCLQRSLEEMKTLLNSS